MYKILFYFTIVVIIFVIFIGAQKYLIKENIWKFYFKFPLFKLLGIYKFKYQNNT